MKSSPMKSKKAIPFMKKVMKAMIMKKLIQAKPMKRPAAANKPADCFASSKCYRREVEPWHERPGGPDQPNWAAHFVDILRAPLQKLKQRLADGTQIVLWSDCAGQCTEMTAADTLAAELRKQLSVDINFRLYAACDKSRQSTDYATHNFRPTHVSADIFQRDFASSTLQCNTCKKPCHLPNAGVDIYCCCCPLGSCGRIGLDDPVWSQAIKTIQHMKPVMFIMETSRSLSVETAEKLSDDYATCTINKSSPTDHGYPTEKMRALVTGGRLDQIDEIELIRSFSKLIDTPLAVEDTYLSFLGIQGLADSVLDSVGLLPNPGDAVMIQKSPCICSIDPMIECPMHPCTCNKCRQQHKGEGTYKPLPCAWRAKASSYLDDAGLRWTAADGGVTYIQMLELMMLSVPQSARERNMLNIIARLPAAQPLRATRMIFDLSQSIDRYRPKYDGVVPTIATRSVMWCMRAGRPLTVSEMAKLMGEDLDDVDLRVTTEYQMRLMLGRSMHVATAGFALTGLMAAFGAGSSGR